MDTEMTENRFLSLLGNEIGEFPSPLQQIKKATQTLSLKYPDFVNEEVEIKIIDINREAIQHKFVLMMQDVFKAIEPELPLYKKHQSILYLDKTIRKNLDPKIYHKSYQLHKLKETPMSGLLNQRELDLANKFFNELFDVMNELLTTMKIYYGYEEDERISEALYASIGTFAEDNQNCFMVEEDNRVTLLEEQRVSSVKGNKNSKEGPVPFEVLVQVLKAVDKDQQKIKNAEGLGILSKATSIFGVAYKYTLAPTVSTAYEKIKSINPFAAGKSLTSEEEAKLKLQLIDHLQPRLSEREPLDEKLITLLIKMFPLSPEEIIQSMSIEEKEKFTNLITDVLNSFQNPSGRFEEIVKELMSILEKVMEIDVQESQNMFEEIMEAKWLILFYKTFEQKYNPERRRVLFSICETHQIREKLLNPIAVVKLIESEKESESPILAKLRSLPVTEKSKEKKYRLSHDKTSDINLDVEHELNRIHLYELKKKFQKTPLIEFQKLSAHSYKRTITFLFSGFMSEDTCKASEWSGFLNTIYDSEVYSIRWESKTYGNLLDYAVGGAKDIAEANLKVGLLGQIGGPYLRAVAVIRELYKKYNSNPFNPAFESANVTGEFLAQFFMSNFKGHFLNLVGFSLGTELIRNVLKRMQKKKCLDMINKVYLMGGVADRKEIGEIVKSSDVPLNIINLHSDNDGALKYLLKVCKPSLQPIGIHGVEEVPGHLIANQDCTSLVDGHMSYREHMEVLSKLMNMKDD